MPPRKKARVSRTASPTPTSQAKTPTPAVEAESHDTDLLSDPWTDTEEIGLFKALIKWKPTGIHKHFRLLQLHQFLLENNYIHPTNEHTKPPGIWRKLQSLYDLDALDQREDARQLSDLELGSDEEKSDDEDEDEDAYSLAANKIHNDEFALPADEDAELSRMMWERRLAGAKAQRDESPMSLPELNLADEPPVRFIPTVSVEPAETATPASRTGRALRGGKGRTRSSLVPGSSTSTRRSARQAESVAAASEKAESEEEEDEEDEDDDEEEEGEDENDAGEEEEEQEEEEDGDNGEEESSEEEEEEEEESAASTPARRSSRSTAGRSRGRPVGRPRGRPRGRGK